MVSIILRHYFPEWCQWLDELPDPIRQYLVYNYADVRIDLALKNNQGYKVILATALELNFDIEGNFLFYDDGGN